MPILLVGDVHGRLRELGALWAKSPFPVVQLGDLGIGMPRVNSLDMPPDLRFLRGNHDQPLVARAAPGYLGDFGFCEDIGTFFVSGAWSIDRPWRTEFVNWWSDEELSGAQLNAAFDLYCELKPRFVLTHDCPPRAFEAMPDESKLSRGAVIPTRTTTALGVMFEAHQPELWVYGHHHVSWQGEIEGTRFRCLNILESAVLDTQTLVWGSN